MKEKLEINNIPTEIQACLDRGVDFRTVKEGVAKYKFLKEIEMVSHKHNLVSFIEIDWDWLYNQYDSTEEQFQMGIKMDEQYGIENIVELQDKYNEQ
jgi:hypothetical protein